MPQTTEFRLGVDGVAAFEFSDGTTKNVDLANLGAGGTVDAASMSAALSATDIAGRATFRSSGFITTHMGLVANEASMLTLANVFQGNTVKRTDTNTDWRCDALPSSTLSNWRNLGTGSGTGTTNLTLTQTASEVTVVSDTGTDATIPTATSSNAGVMSAAQVTALAGKQSAISSGTSKLLSAPATNGADPVQITLGTNLSLSGTTLNATGGSTTVVNDLTTGGTTSALSAEQGKTLKTLVDSKAEYHAAAAETQAVILTAGAHADRRVDINSATPVAVTWNVGHGMSAGASGRLMQVSTGAITVSAGTGTVDRSPNVDAGALSTTGVGSWIDWEYMGGDLLRVTGIGKAVPVAGAYAMPVPVADVSSGAAGVDVVLGDVMLPALGANAEVECWLEFDGTGTGGRIWKLKLDGVGTAGTLLTLSSITNSVGRIRLGFRNQNSTSIQAGQNSNVISGVGYGASGTVYTGAVDTSVPKRLTLILSKNTPADVVNFKGARFMVYQ